MKPSTASPSPPPVLQGLRILSVEQYGAGPFGTQYLADLGAEVIKIENRKDGGDVGRMVGPGRLGRRAPPRRPPQHRLHLCRRHGLG